MNMELETILKASVNAMVYGHHKPYCYSAWVQGKGYVNKGEPLYDRADYLRQLERDAINEIDNMRYAPAYVEPGYTQQDKGILFADWNKFPKELDDILEKLGYGVEWLDEWSLCGDCGRAVRNSPDSYGWKQSYVIFNGGDLICVECIQSNLDGYEEHLLNNTSSADTLGIDWSSRGFKQFNNDAYENGFHPGQNDDPKEIVKQLPANHDFLFSINSVGQFDCHFDCWIRLKVETEK